ncbi:oocyte zinc finger protein XlCOF26-like [Trichogramma pretiosum]|uniref:oocyte zinc finger protein XlCOF26-like n=1 Tax=Trichogramma pretiosum TaxID=7493 RepID=UPI0006C967FA|nr:oocyte zinc finger protein XlCOF26-like [Trichogramma pretiosum]
MESSGLFNGAIRVKEEPAATDVPLIENEGVMTDEKPDLENFRLLPFPRENSAVDTLPKCDIKHEIKFDDEVEIVVECEDVKPNKDLLEIKKIDHYTPNHSRNVKDIHGCETKNVIKIETAEDVKQEFVGYNVEEPNLNLDFELADQNKKRGITKKLTNEHNLKTHMSTVHSGAVHTCKTCGKTFKHKFTLNRHVKSRHDGVTHACNTCGKSFTQKSYLKTHINTVHNGVKCACDICGKKFTSKANLRIHIDSVHLGTTHACDLCEKKFTKKSILKAHIDIMHNDVAPTCDTCRKKFLTKSNLKQHIDSAHNGVTHECDICGKIFSYKGNLKTHIDAVHTKITHECVVCGKKFKSKNYLKIHIIPAHDGVK